MRVRSAVLTLVQKPPVVLGIAGAILPIVSRNVALLLWSPRHFPMLGKIEGEISLAIIGATVFFVAGNWYPIHRGVVGAFERCRFAIASSLMVVVTAGVHAICAVGSFGVGASRGRSTAAIGFFFAPLWGLVAFIAGYLAATIIVGAWRLANRTQQE